MKVVHPPQFGLRAHNPRVIRQATPPFVLISGWHLYPRFLRVPRNDQGVSPIQRSSTLSGAWQTPMSRRIWVSFCSEIGIGPLFGRRSLHCAEKFETECTPFVSELSRQKTARSNCEYATFAGPSTRCLGAGDPAKSFPARPDTRDHPILQPTGRKSISTCKIVALVGSNSRSLGAGDPTKSFPARPETRDRSILTLTERKSRFSFIEITRKIPQWELILRQAAPYSTKSRTDGT